MKTITILSALVLLLASCQVVKFDEDENGNTTAKGEKTMHFRLTAYSMNNLNEIPDGNDDTTADGDASTRAIPQNATDHFLLGIYDDKGNLVDTIVYQDKDDTTLPTYGTFTHTLKFGKYTLLALGWNGNQKCTVHRPDSISFSEDWVPHTFLCRQNIVVSESYSDTRSLSLKRCVAKFTLKFKDASIPQEVSDFIIRFTGAGCTLNGETRHCARQNDFERAIPVTIDPSRVKSITSYCFLPADSTGLSINVTAYDTDGNTLADKTFEDVPMKINYETKYSGHYFPFGSIEGSIDFDTNFDGEFNAEF
ncbi:MAG: FimB/Mfa2 family fimbrial subunit [Bacteroides sp.]|nr:FimB/Mfa2 family fimbrial subunit [Bacteroides sp.]MCM1447129.1 FimB/Mfa2 family fimbrial subunit [Bacteroides sp.]